MSNFQISTNQSWGLCLTMCLVAALMIMPDMAQAAASSSAATAGGITTVLCTVVTALTGPIGRAVGMIALVVLGMGIFLGKLSWPLALATALGITFIFSASTIMGWLSGGSATSTC